VSILSVYSDSRAPESCGKTSVRTGITAGECKNMLVICFAVITSLFVGARVSV
jgi:hypothetical protein